MAIPWTFSWTPKTDDQDTIFASDVNTLADGIIEAHGAIDDTRDMLEELANRPVTIEASTDAELRAAVEGLKNTGGKIKITANTRLTFPLDIVFGDNVTIEVFSDDRKQLDFLPQTTIQSESHTKLILRNLIVVMDYDDAAYPSHRYNNRDMEFYNCGVINGEIGDAAYDGDGNLTFIDCSIDISPPPYKDVLCHRGFCAKNITIDRSNIFLVHGGYGWGETNLSYSADSLTITNSNIDGVEGVYHGCKLSNSAAIYLSNNRILFGTSPLLSIGGMYNPRIIAIGNYIEYMGSYLSGNVILCNNILNHKAASETDESTDINYLWGYHNIIALMNNTPATISNNQFVGSYILIGDGSWDKNNKVMMSNNIFENGYSYILGSGSKVIDNIGVEI